MEPHKIVLIADNHQGTVIEQYAACVVCDQSHALFSSVLGLCPDCAGSSDGMGQASAVHQRSRRLFKLPTDRPSTQTGVVCQLCARECQIGEGERGFCGLREVQGGKINHLAGTPARGLLHWYRDPLPTNCVADWVCSGHTQCGKHNLAVFYQSCTIDCLFCQNWHFRDVDIARSQKISARSLAESANSRTYCVCFFGGDPASQMPHALATAKYLTEKGVVVCWETAGTANPRFIDRAVQFSLHSGGCIKFDLKAYTEALHIALTGFSNKRTLANFSRAAQRYRNRPDPPLVIASTLLVPGYITASEVRKIAQFIAEINPEIPYALLGFYPNFLMHDLPVTSIQHAKEAEQAALEAGLKNVRIGNRHLLGYQAIDYKAGEDTFL